MLAEKLLNGRPPLVDPFLKIGLNRIALLGIELTARPRIIRDFMMLTAIGQCRRNKDQHQDKKDKVDFFIHPNNPHGVKKGEVEDKGQIGAGQWIEVVGDSGVNIGIDEE